MLKRRDKLVEQVEALGPAALYDCTAARRRALDWRVSAAVSSRRAGHTAPCPIHARASTPAGSSARAACEIRRQVRRSGHRSACRDAAPTRRARDLQRGAAAAVHRGQTDVVEDHLAAETRQDDARRHGVADDDAGDAVKCQQRVDVRREVGFRGEREAAIPERSFFVGQQRLGKRRVRGEAVLSGR